MEHELKDIRYQSQTHKKLLSLINRVNPTSLMIAHEKQKRQKAAGVDGVVKTDYDEHVVDNVVALTKRMKAFEYVPRPVRRTYIPKTNGKLRPLGIPAYEDKLVQSVMADILRDVYEPRFLDCSYGFRPGRGAHDVLRKIDRSVMKGRVNYVLEADIRGFFDNLDQKWLMKFLEHDIADRNFLRYIVRFLKAGIMEGTELLKSDRGTPQGGLISPILANVYLHYVLDLWIEKHVKKFMRGETHYVRYADDFLLTFQYEEDAITVMRWLKDRLAKFGLEVAEDKTRILPFGKYRGTKESFDFLGFTFINAKTLKGWYRLGIISSQKKMKAKREAFKVWLRTRINKPMIETLKLVNLALQGHYNYYGVNGNMKALIGFMWYVRRRVLWMLRRRSQVRKIRVAKFVELWDAFVKPPEVKVSIWGAVSTQTWGAVCGKSARTVLRGGGIRYAG